MTPCRRYEKCLWVAKDRRLSFEERHILAGLVRAEPALRNLQARKRAQARISTVRADEEVGVGEPIVPVPLHAEPV